MSPGGKEGGKHWSAAEILAREEAAKLFERKNVRRLRVPAHLSDEAKKVWRKTVERIKGMDLLDVIDTDMLAIYCDAVAKYNLMSISTDVVYSDEKNIRALQSQARLVSQYADKLGFTPAARARLIKKRADKILEEDDFGKDFD